MNNTQKILIAIGVGVGVAYVYNKYYKKGKSTTGTKATGKATKGSFELPEETATANMSREEKEEFILDNVSATPQEISSGFEGVHFGLVKSKRCWNCQARRNMYSGKS